jgi:hypothetical protein
MNTPRTLGGLLGPGDRVTRRYSRALPEGYFPMVQSFPRDSIVIADQSATSVTLQSTGPRIGTYLVVFMNQDTARGMMALKQAYDSFRKSK